MPRRDAPGGRTRSGAHAWATAPRVEKWFTPGTDPEAATGFAPVQTALLDRFGTGLPREGADLIRIRGGRVVAESATGVGNDRNYGVRNLLTDGKTLYVGTANPMNLDPKGGWELLKLTPR